MQLLRQRRGIVVYSLNSPADIKSKLALDLATVERNSYLVRFPDISHHAIDQCYKVGSALNMGNVMQLLKKKEWLWLFAYQGSTMVGYVLVEIRADNAWVVELHTDLTRAKRKRVGTLLLCEALKLASKQVGKSILWVDKRSQTDNFPYNWYVSMGYRPTGGTVEEFTLGTATLKKYPMRGNIKTIIAYLESKL